MLVPIGYHWDTSDWRPSTSRPLPGISEFHGPTDSMLAPLPDHDDLAAVQRLIHPEDDYAITDYPDEDDEELDGNESEYVCDSEFVDNEDDDEDTDFPADHPSFQELLEGDPQKYFPHYGDLGAPSQENVDDAGATEMTELNGNLSAADDVMYYGFPKPSTNQRRRRGNPFRQSLVSNDNRYSGDFGLDFAGGTTVDDMSVSVGGYTSTNASMSDMSGLCDIDDSEANLTDYDSGDDNTSQRLNSTHMHTVVWWQTKSNWTNCNMREGTKEEA